jgi:hypothetical protein
MARRTSIPRIVATYVFILIVSLALTLIGLEALFRLNDDQFRRFFYLNYDPPMYAPAESMPYTLRPNISSVHFRRGEFDTFVRTNSQGLREDREIALPKPKNTLRIAVLGDSFGFGYGVARSETFQAAAERQLQRLYPGRMIEIVNMGFASAGSLDARYVYMRDTLPAFEPDVVLSIFFYGADLGRLVENRPYSTYDAAGLPVKAKYFPIEIDPDTGFRTGRFEFETEKAARLFFPHYFTKPGLGEQLPLVPLDAVVQALPDLIKAGDWDGVCRRLRLCLVVRKNLEIRRARAGDSGLYQHQLLMLPGQPQNVGTLLLDYPAQARDGLPVAPPGVKSEAREGWLMAQRIFGGMQRLAETRGQKFGVIFVPSPVLVDHDSRDGADYALNRFYDVREMARAVELQKPDRLFGRWFKTNGIAYLDPARLMRSDRIAAGRKFYFPYDQHWNADGHASLGHHVANWIKEQRWLD